MSPRSHLTASVSSIAQATRRWLSLPVVEGLWRLRLFLLLIAIDLTGLVLMLYRLAFPLNDADTLNATLFQFGWVPGLGITTKALDYLTDLFKVGRLEDWKAEIKGRLDALITRALGSARNWSFVPAIGLLLLVSSLYVSFPVIRIATEHANDGKSRMLCSDPPYRHEPLKDDHSCLGALSGRYHRISIRTGLGRTRGKADLKVWLSRGAFTDVIRTDRSQTEFSRESNDRIVTIKFQPDVGQTADKFELVVVVASDDPTSIRAELGDGGKLGTACEDVVVDETDNWVVSGLRHLRPAFGLCRY